MATFYTNPITIIPLYIAAFHIGEYLLPGSYALPPFADAPIGTAAWVSAMSVPSRRG